MVEAAQSKSTTETRMNIVQSIGNKQNIGVDWLERNQEGKGAAREGESTGKGK